MLAEDDADICFNWNEDNCDDSECPYLHACSECFAPNHRAFDQLCSRHSDEESSSQE
jgi:hypothetical protein